jgi:hypothetical protein
MQTRTSTSWGRSLGFWVGAALLISVSSRPSLALDTIRLGMQIGASGSIRLSLPEVEKRDDLKFDLRNFSDSTAMLLALDQGELEMTATTSQHLIRAIDEGMDVVMVIGIGSGYNVIVATPELKLKPGDWPALKAETARRKAAGNPLVQTRRPVVDRLLQGALTSTGTP